MKRDEVFETVKKLMGKVMMTLTNAQVKEEDRLIDDLGMDSMAAVDLVFALEDNYQIQISDEEAGNVKTVNEVIDLVMQKVEGTTAS